MSASRLRVESFSISLDGYGAGPEQTLQNPLGLNGDDLHEWFLPTRTFRALQGEPGGEAGLEDDLIARGFENLGAWIMGRNMFGPVRGEWPDETWKGWWGDNPPYHTPVIVLTHHPRRSVEMEGGTVFHFETGGIHAALERARAFADGKDIRLGGGVSTIHQYLKAGLVDEMRLAVSPALLGSGEPFWAGIDLPALGYQVASVTSGPRAQHLLVTRKADGR